MRYSDSDPSVRPAIFDGVGECITKEKDRWMIGGRLYDSPLDSDAEYLVHSSVPLSAREGLDNQTN